MQYARFFNFLSCDSEMNSKIKIFSCCNAVIIEPIDLKLLKAMIIDESLHEMRSKIEILNSCYFFIKPMIFKRHNNDSRQKSPRLRCIRLSTSGQMTQKWGRSSKSPIVLSRLLLRL